ncbi:MAG: dihydrofolate reductase [Bacteroidetes bacterium]|nr:MAG: dihydrofolate reductase [Bacteroidota bacterium]
MGKICLNLAISLDGFIEGPDGSFDWCFTDQDYGMTEFLGQTEAILFGRKSFQVLKEMDSDPYPDKLKYIYSNTLTYSGKNLLTISDHAVERTLDLKKEYEKDLWLFGGAKLIAEMQKADLIDEYILSIHPILLGAGKRLFSSDQEKLLLKLLSTK